MTPPTEPAAGRHALTYRPTTGRYEWLRDRAYLERRSMQSIIDEALDQAMRPTAQDLSGLGHDQPGVPAAPPQQPQEQQP